MSQTHRNPSRGGAYVVSPCGALQRIARTPPDTGAPAPAAPAAVRTPRPQPAVLDLLDNSIRSIADALPALSDHDLARLERGERAGKTRKGVLAAIDAERARRQSITQE